MLSFADYRKKKIREAIERADNFSEAFEKQFEYLKLDLLSAFTHNEFLTESHIEDDEDLKNIVEVAVKLYKLEGYKINSIIIAEHLQGCRSVCAKIVEDAAAAVDNGWTIDDVKKRIGDEINTVMKQVKDLVVNDIDASQQEDPIANPLAADPDEDGGDGVVPGADGEEGRLPDVTVGGQQPTPPSQPPVRPGDNPHTMGSRDAAKWATDHGHHPMDRINNPDGAQGSDNRTAIPKRTPWRNFMNRIKGYFSPKAWKDWWQGKGSTNQLQDLLQHDPKFKSMIDKRWNRQFKHESFDAIDQILSEENATQMVDLSNKIDAFARQLSDFIGGQLDQYAATAQAGDAGASQALGADDTPEPEQPKPQVTPKVAPQQDEPEETPQVMATPQEDEPEAEAPAPQVVAPSPQQDDEEALKPAAQTAAPTATVDSGSMTKEQFLDKLPKTRGPLRREMEKGFDMESLRNGVGNVHQIYEDGKVDSNSSRKLAMYIAKQLGLKHPNGSGGGIPRSVGSLEAKYWAPMLDSIEEKLKGMGLLSGQKEEAPPTVQHKGRSPETAAPTAVSNNDGEPEAPTQPEPKAPEQPAASSDDWRSVNVEKLNSHDSQFDMDAGEIYGSLIDDHDADDVQRAMAHYWDSNGLKTWDGVDAAEVGKLLSGEAPAAPTAQPEKTEEPKPEVTPKQEEKPPKREEPPKTEPPKQKEEPKAEEPPKVEDPPKSEPKTELNLKDLVFGPLQDYLRDNFTPSIDGENLKKFLGQADLNSIVTPKDLESQAGLEKLRKAFEEFNGVELKKIEDEEEETTEEPEDNESGEVPDYDPNKGYYSSGDDDDYDDEEEDDADRDDYEDEWDRQYADNPDGDDVEDEWDR